MAILVTVTLPEGVSLAMLDEVNAEMKVEVEPPAGLIVHTAYALDQRVHAVDVWESKDAFDRFGQSQLGPAVAKVAAAHGMVPSPPETTMVELHEVLRGR